MTGADGDAVAVEVAEAEASAVGVAGGASSIGATSVGTADTSGACST
ncbi:hypothetical protein [Pseudarthrobacter sp. NamE2]|nr:hypothetical protein [Pseudarthrobacter sp. NamE2]